MSSDGAAVGWLHLFLDVPRADFAAARDFWAAVTRCTPSAPRGEAGQFLTLLPDDGPAWLKMQAVDGPGGVHLDLDTLDRDAAVARATELGASYVSTYEDVVVQRSPGGFTFCHTVGEPQQVQRFDRPLIDQVTLEVPALLWHAELEFWSALLGRTPTAGNHPEFVRLLADGQPRLMLLRSDEMEGEVRAHPDVAVVGRPAETRRHVELGASVEVIFDYWTVMRAPSGQVYCLTDRDPVTGDVRPTGD